MVMSTDKPVKLSPSERAFVLFLFRGNSQTMAYRTAFPKSQNWSDNAVYVQASRLANSPKIILSLAELQKTCEDPTIASVIERKRKLTTYQRANLIDFINPDGEPELSKETPGHEAAAEYEVSTRYTKTGDKVITKRIKLRDPIAAIAEHNRMERIGQPDTVVNQPINIIFMVGKGYQESAQSAQTLAETPPTKTIEAKS